LATKPGDHCPAAGDLVWVDLNPTLGHEQAGHRPAIVLTPRSYNEPSGLCILCPITSRARGYPFEVAIPHGNPISGVVLADQPRSVSWEKRHVKIAGMASAKLVEEVRERLAVLLQID
jgi:mRNA interferase MazF